MNRYKRQFLQVFEFLIKKYSENKIILNKKYSENKIICTQIKFADSSFAYELSTVFSVVCKKKVRKI